MIENNLTLVLNETNRQQKIIIADSIMQSSIYTDFFRNPRNFFIIDKLERHVFGPLPEKRFVFLSINLKISDDLVNDILDSP